MKRSKEEISEYNRQYKRSKSGVVQAIYDQQKSSSKLRGHHAPTYTKQELKEWLYSQELFHVLYDNWKRLDYQTMYKPSVDRKDDYIGYTMENIHLMTWGENKKKGEEDKRHGINNKNSKAVLQLDENEVLIAEYPSQSIAARQLNISHQNISKCIQGKRSHAGGFLWKRKDNNGLPT